MNLTSACTSGATLTVPVSPRVTGLQVQLAGHESGFVESESPEWILKLSLKVEQVRVHLDSRNESNRGLGRLSSNVTEKLLDIGQLLHDEKLSAEVDIIVRSTGLLTDPIYTAPPPSVLAISAPPTHVHAHFLHCSPCRRRCGRSCPIPSEPSCPCSTSRYNRAGWTTCSCRTSSTASTDPASWIARWGNGPFTKSCISIWAPSTLVSLSLCACGCGCVCVCVCA